MQVSVNLSSIQIRDPNVVGQVNGVLNEFGLKPESLRIEVTESAIMENPTLSGVALAKLREHGVKVAIDDFGTGYSSLAYIHQLSPDVVKIDRSFVDQITSSTDKSTIVGAIIALAEGLNLDVVAEGIETESQRKLLYMMGCSFGQGFLFARPLRPDQVLDFVSAGLSAEISNQLSAKIQ